MFQRISLIATLLLTVAMGTVLAGPVEDLSRVESLFRDVEGAARTVDLTRAQSKLQEAGALLDRLYQSQRSPEVLDKFATLRSWNERLAILERLEGARAQLAEAQKRAGAMGLTSQELLAVAERSIRGAQRSLAVPLSSAVAAPGPASPPSAGPRRHDEVFLGPERPVTARPPELVGMRPSPADSQDARGTVEHAWNQYVSRLGNQLLPALPSPAEVATQKEALQGKAVHLKGLNEPLRGLSDKASWWFKTAQGAYVILHFDRVVLETYGATLVQGETVSFPDRPIDVVATVNGLKKILGDTGAPVDAVILEVRALRTPLGFISEDGAGVTRPLKQRSEGFLAWLWWLVTRLFYLALILAGVLVLMIVLLLIYFKIDEWRYERQFANEEWETGTPPPSEAEGQAPRKPSDCSSGSCSCCSEEDCAPPDSSEEEVKQED